MALALTALETLATSAVVTEGATAAIPDIAKVLATYLAMNPNSGARAFATLVARFAEVARAIPVARILEELVADGVMPTDIAASLKALAGGSLAMDTPQLAAERTLENLRVLEADVQVARGCFPHLAGRVGRVIKARFLKITNAKRSKKS